MLHVIVQQLPRPAFGADAERLATTLNTERRHLSEKQRREAAIDLRKQGHSTRAIAGALGVGASTVRRDVARAPRGAPEKVVGRDGKSYPATRPPSDNGELRDARADAAERYEFLHGPDWRDRAAVETAAVLDRRPRHQRDHRSQSASVSVQQRTRAARAMVRITSQKQMQEARRRVEFCYLCGQALPPRGTPGRRKAISTEHVIPECLLGDKPEKPPDQWPVVLDVHRTCENTLKGPTDNLAAMLHKISTLPTDQWPKRGHVLKLGLEPVLLQRAAGRRPETVMTNAQDVILAVWIWIRGLHAALYNEFLPDDDAITVLPPAPAYSVEEGGSSPEVWDAYSHTILMFVELARNHGVGDGVVGRQLLYACVWFHDEAADDTHRWRCNWLLDFPGVLEWSQSVLPRGEERPWHGSYTVPHRPNGASEFPRVQLPLDPPAT